jgi:hypothetical protein
VISRDLSCLAVYLVGRANRGEPLDRAEMRQIAAMIDSWLPSLRAMEGRPVPPNWRVIAGGRDIEPPPRIA